MQTIKDKVTAFFDKYGLSCGTIDIEKNCKMFVEEMKSGLAGNESSLPMIPTYIELFRKIPTDKSVIVIDAGGTSLRRAVVHFNNQNEPVIEDYKKYPMPGTCGEITSNEFFRLLVSYLQPVITKSDTIAFCFSFTTETLPNKDARVTMMGKQIEIKGIVGEHKPWCAKVVAANIELPWTVKCDCKPKDKSQKTAQTRAIPRNRMAWRL